MPKVARGQHLTNVVSPLYSEKAGVPVLLSRKDLFRHSFYADEHRGCRLVLPWSCPNDRFHLSFPFKNHYPKFRGASFQLTFNPHSFSGFGLKRSRTTISKGHFKVRIVVIECIG